MAKILRLYYTVRPLRFEQFWYRLRYKFFPLGTISIPKDTFLTNNWCWQGLEVITPTFIGEGEVSFLSLSASVNVISDWNNPEFEKLWLYNLHYFDDLNAVDSLSRRAIQLSMVKRWITENPPVIGNGWEPYPLSLRLVNLIKWYHRAGVDEEAIVYSISQQAEALSKQLEYHILGNHLFANAKALVFVGCFLKGAAARRYLKLGMKILQREIPEQFLSDGGHFELSPMYHCILLWDLFDLINLAKLTQGPELLAVRDLWEQYAVRALNWLRVMQHPDGEVSFFNDSAVGIAASPAHLFEYASFLGLVMDNKQLSPLVTLTSSGYSRVTYREHSLFFDHAAVGPDYLPGHAHADTLSVEWSVGHERVFVNSGTSVYGVSDERLRQRKTAAHNTVEVDGFDSSEVWSGFRVARRAYSHLLDAQVQDGVVELTASHDGYQRLKGQVTHHRTIRSSVNSILIEDTLAGDFNSAVVHWHLHPDVALQRVSDSELKLVLSGGKCIVLKCSKPVSVQASTWHPSFGETVRSCKITAEFDDEKLTTLCRVL
jgi:uncharacterized heparinase superfamily protein